MVPASPSPAVTAGTQIFTRGRCSVELPQELNLCRGDLKGSVGVVQGILEGIDTGRNHSHFIREELAWFLFF